MNVQDPHLHLVDPSHPTKQTHFGCLYWQSLSFLGGGVTSCSSTPDTSTGTVKSKLILARVPLYQNGLV